MGQGQSRKNKSRGLVGVGAADGALTISCPVEATLAGLDGGLAGSGWLQTVGAALVVVQDERRIAECDPVSETAALLRTCMNQGFEYRATVTVSDAGMTRIDVARG